MAEHPPEQPSADEVDDLEGEAEGQEIAFLEELEFREGLDEEETSPEEGD